MKKHLLILFIVVSGFLSPTITFAQTVQKPDLKQLDAYFEKSRVEWQVPGMAIVIIKDDSIVLAKGYGLRKASSAEKVDEKTVFGIASNTKAFTAAAIMTLVDDGKIALDDRVTKYLPWFQLYDPYVSNEMRIRDLLCHRSGLETFSGDLLWYDTKYSREEVVKRAKYLKPKYGFRTTYGYSNIMFLAAGEIIKVVTGKTWDEYIAEKFLAPLKMTITNTSIEKNKGNNNVASPHVLKDGKPLPIPYINWDNIAPAGAINSNITDMAKWLRLQLHNGTLNGTKFFSKEASAQMWSSLTVKEVSESDEYLLPSMHFHSYGLGWDLFDYHGRKIVNHSGGLDGMVSHVCLVPEENLAFAVLSNSSSWLPEALMYKITDEFLTGESKDWSKLFYSFYQYSEKEKLRKKQEADEKRAKNTKPSLSLEKYTGTYSGDIYGDAKVTLENGKLKMQFMPAPDFVSGLDHWQYDTFTIRFENFPSLPEGTVNFTINANGDVEQMRVDVPNPDFDFTELEFKKVIDK